MMNYKQIPYKIVSFALQIKVDLLVFANHPGVAVGVSDM